MLKTLSPRCHKGFFSFLKYTDLVVSPLWPLLTPELTYHSDAPPATLSYKLFFGSLGLPKFISAFRSLLLLAGAFSFYSLCCCVTFLRSIFVDHPAWAVAVHICLFHSLSHASLLGPQFSHGVLCTFPRGPYHSVISRLCVCFLMCWLSPPCHMWVLKGMDLFFSLLNPQHLEKEWPNKYVWSERKSLQVRLFFFFPLSEALKRSPRNKEASESWRNALLMTLIPSSENKSWEVYIF